MQIKLKWRVNLAVKLLLPPPGGAEQIHKIVSWISFQNLSFLSYNPPLSIKNRSNSIGGWAPYSSTDGMLISSINTAVFLFGFAPSNVFLIFSNLPSIVSYVTYEDVYAEKIKLKWSTLLVSCIYVRIVERITDFPVPLIPVRYICFLNDSNHSVKKLYLTVSNVGTKRLK